MGERSSTLLAQHNSLVIIMNAALGDGKGSAGPPKSANEPGVKNLAEGHGSVDDAVAAINNALRF